MTILTIMRHAKSSWDDAALDDFDRPLNERGWKAARRMGRELEKRRVRFDQVIASPAMRVRETLEGLANGFGETFNVRFERAIYEASADTLFGIVRSIPHGVHAPLIAGHNPGLQRLVLKLVSEDDKLREKLEHGFPTSAVAIIELPAVQWEGVEAHSGIISELILAKELD